jgi:hypothetical protein
VTLLTEKLFFYFLYIIQKEDKRLQKYWPLWKNPVCELLLPGGKADASGHLLVPPQGRFPA